MKIQYTLSSILLFFCIVGCTTGKSTVETELIPLDPHNITRLITREAALVGGVKLVMPEDPYKSFWAENWTSPDQSLQWLVSSPDKNKYKTALLVCAENLNPGEKVVLECSTSHHKIAVTINKTGWQRIWMDTPLELHAGESTLNLRIQTPGENPKFQIQFYSMEMVLPDQYTRIEQEAASLKADTRWMSDINYGFFFHWNSKSMPRSGESKSYEEAVKAFDVDKFAETVNTCGAKLIFFTTSWAEYYFPAPIQTIDSILPGRTTTRDLVADLSEALGKYNIKLILYYHVGHGDKVWWEKQNFALGKPGNLYTNLEKILREVSLRYGKKLAGLWLDDGMGYYPNKTPFDKLTKAAKAGNKDLVICYNPWLFPKFTDYQDYYAGEVGLSEASAGQENPYLPIGGNGIFTDGPQKGLQATYTGVLEPGEWTHVYKDTEIEAPLLSSDQLIRIVKESNKRKNLPMMNVCIYQDGTISPTTFKQLVELKEALEIQ